MAHTTGAKFFADTLKAYGVTHVFVAPSVAARGLAELSQLGVKSIVTHGEKAAAYMADGYARAANRPGVCLAQSVGAANMAAGLQDAYLGPVAGDCYDGPQNPDGAVQERLPGNRTLQTLRVSHQIQRLWWRPWSNSRTCFAKPSERRPRAPPLRYTWTCRA